MVACNHTVQNFENLCNWDNELMWHWLRIMDVAIGASGNMEDKKKAACVDLKNRLMR